jgi:hypothetical protein
VVWLVGILAAIGVMLLAASVGLALAAWRKRSLVEAAISLFVLVVISWFGYTLLVTLGNRPG